MNINTLINSRLTRLMNEGGIKKIEVCRGTGISTGNFSDAYNNKKNWGLDNLLKLQKFFNISLDWLTSCEPVNLNKNINMENLNAVYQKNIKALLVKNNITQYRLRKETKIPCATLSRAINGKGGLKIEQLSLIAKYFGVSCESLCISKSIPAYPVKTSFKETTSYLKKLLKIPDNAIVETRSMTDKQFISQFKLT